MPLGVHRLPFLAHDEAAVLAEGWLFVAVVLDLFSRRVVGWVLARRAMDEGT